ncbi:hypothetical protein [Clostridium beijerinckii]|nr:hypothetical protein [Clostridium beijerinckii]
MEKQIFRLGKKNLWVIIKLWWGSQMDKGQIKMKLEKREAFDKKYI